MPRCTHLLALSLVLGLVFTIPVVAGDTEPTIPEATDSIVTEEVLFTPMDGQMQDLISVEELRRIHSFGACDEDRFCPGCEACFEILGKITCFACS